MTEWTGSQKSEYLFAVEGDRVLIKRPNDDSRNALELPTTLINDIKKEMEIQKGLRRARYYELKREFEGEEKAHAT